jgi:DNA-directed RNA polymerase subunit K/omega
MGGQGGEVRKPNKVRVTTPYLTKYERARVLGTRALQIRCVHTALTAHD